DGKAAPDHAAGCAHAPVHASSVASAKGKMIKFVSSSMSLLGDIVLSITRPVGLIVFEVRRN
ncbi:MAG: hypothetical protein ABIT83_27315, partial [Massilia sp.]